MAPRANSAPAKKNRRQPVGLSYYGEQCVPLGYRAVCNISGGASRKDGKEGNDLVISEFAGESNSHLSIFMLCIGIRQPE